MTNHEIEAAKTPQQKAADRGMAAQVSLSETLRRGYVLIRGTGRDSNRAEIRDTAEHDSVIASGTYAKMINIAKKMGLRD
jgi:hypothetical protein